ncbi:unnamed protein product [Rhizoctonia solani]|uniref:F-box domain-containing protein n=1 Tax=Rhizoctonia solani TaxID=456999 RepID=A0A8H2ZXH2_9AGAM|nr:unnamed protein product [Rhizoctonia solani]
MNSDSAVMAPRKRRRTQKKQACEQDHRLSLLDMPIEILSEVGSYVLPIDLLSLSRTNKSLRSLLMDRSSRHVWQSAMQNMEGLPHCPSNWSEPRYLSLIFSKTCSICNKPARSRIDEVLLVRLCGGCRDEKLMPLGELPKSLYSLVHHSTRITRRESHVLREDAEAVCNRYNQLRKYGDGVLFGAWVEHRKRRTSNRRKHALKLIEFLDALEQGQIHERDDLKATRRAEVDQRRHGFYNYQWKKQWLALVEQPKQLTERVWTNLYPKLHDILESNRQARLTKERAERQRARKTCLKRFLFEIECNNPPLLKFEFQKSTGSQQNYRFRDIFPDVEDVLEWPLIQTMNDNDLSVTAFRQQLTEHKDDISNLLTQWREKIRAHMVTLLRTENRTYNPILEPPESSTSDPFIDLSDDFKLLLRADTLFYLARTFNGIRFPFVYHETVEAGHDTYCCDRQGLWVGGKKDPLDMDRFRRYSNAQKVARVLLRSIGKPNASFLELETEDYICGRCHDTKPRSWGEMVQHYVEQKRTYMRIQESAPKLAKKGITYNDVHDPEFDEDQPLIRILEPRISDKKVVPLRECNLCIKKPIALELVASENKLLRHLLEVHDIAEPELGVDYDISDRSTFGLEAGFGYDFRDADDNESDSESGDEEESDSDYDGEGQRWVSSFWFVHNGRWVKPGY